MIPRRQLGSGRSRSVVVARRVVGEMQECAPPKPIAPSDSYVRTVGSYANTLDPVGPDGAVAATTQRATATVIVDALRIVSLFLRFASY